MTTTPRPFRPSRTLVVIPTYNEAGNVTTVLDRVHTAAPNVDIADATEHIASDALGGRHPRRGRRCRGAWVWAGVPAVPRREGRTRCRVPGRVRRRLSLRRRRRGRQPVPERLISRAGNLYVRLVLGLSVHDTTAGFKAFRSDALERIGVVASVSNGYCFQVENTWRAVRLGLMGTEVPITFTDRTVGTSKMSRAIVIEALTRVLVWRWHEMRHRTGPALGAGSHHVAA